jgi:hypothetical protein
VMDQEEEALVKYLLGTIYSCLSLVIQYNSSSSIPLLLESTVRHLGSI